MGFIDHSLMGRGKILELIFPDRATNVMSLADIIARRLRIPTALILSAVETGVTLYWTYGADTEVVNAELNRISEAYFGTEIRFLPICFGNYSRLIAPDTLFGCVRSDDPVITMAQCPGVSCCPMSFLLTDASFHFRKTSLEPKSARSALTAA